MHPFPHHPSFLNIRSISFAFECKLLLCTSPRARSSPSWYCWAFCSCWRWTIVASSRWAESPELSNDFHFKLHSVLALVAVRVWEISVGLFQGLSQCWPWTVFCWLLEYFSTSMERVKPDAFRIQINCIFRKEIDWIFFGLALNKIRQSVIPPFEHDVNWNTALKKVYSSSCEHAKIITSTWILNKLSVFILQFPSSKLFFSPLNRQT